MWSLLVENRAVRRGLLMGAVWAFGVVIAVALAFAAVDRVASGVSSRDDARLSQRAIDDELGRSPTPPRSSSSTSTTRPPSVSTTSSTVASTISSPTTTPATTTVTTASPPPPVSHNTVTASRGGTLFTRCSGPDRIVFVAAVPKSGYQRTVDDERSGAIRQSFENSNHRSTIEAECSDGTVHAQVEEESAGE